MARFAFVTCAALPALTSDDRLAVAELEALGHHVTPVNWSDPSCDWTSFDAAVLRSCWDYHHRPDEFRTWLHRMASAGVRLINSVRLARWNMEKSYLRDLASAGVATVPSRLVAQGTNPDLDALRGSLGADSLVVKPTISATADATWHIGERDRTWPDGFHAALGQHDFLVQPFVPEIRNGEWSLILFDGVFSHAVLKRPKAGDFRVQHEFGGTAEAKSPPDQLVDLAGRILGTLPETPVYARVDGVETAGGFLLLELELLEPALFLATAGGAARRFADAIVARGEPSAAFRVPTSDFRPLTSLVSDAGAQRRRIPDLLDLDVPVSDVEERLPVADADRAVAGCGRQEGTKVAGDTRLEIQDLLDGVVTGTGQALQQRV
ncbi:MAG TPA: hypothetical protein VIL35_01150 [Vicinamibacterales bacterium]